MLNGRRAWIISIIRGTCLAILKIFFFDIFQKLKYFPRIGIVEFRKNFRNLQITCPNSSDLIWTSLRMMIDLNHTPLLDVFKNCGILLGLQ